MKIFAWILGILAILVIGFYALNGYIYNEKQVSAAEDYKNAEYVIEGKRVQLNDGVAESEAAPGSQSKIVTRYFGNELVHDLNDNGRDDVVFLLTQETGGSGTFYYVVAALNTPEGYVGSQALLLGDRIAPQTTELSQNPNHQNVIVVNYADRGSTDPMTTPPYVGKSIWLKLDPEALQFGEVAQDFEGEADPSRMTLWMKSWTWVSALYNDGREVKPNKPGTFTITLTDDGKFTATTDCNSMGGSYVSLSSRQYGIIFTDIYMTKKFCEGSQEMEFAQLLENTDTYHFTSRGELVFDLKFDSGSVIFR